MPEYIEREKLYDFLTEQLDKETGMYSKGRNNGINVARSALHNREITPAADVAPVVPELRVAVRFLQKEYERAKKNPVVRNPVAYALFQTWKAVDNCENGR